MSWLSRNWLGLVVCVTLLIVALSVSYYFVIFLPQEHQLRLEMDRQEKAAAQQRREEREREERRIKEEQSIKQHNSELLDTCLSDAGVNYITRWNNACKEGFGRGGDTKEKCALPEWMADGYMKDYNTEKEDCFKRYPQR